MQKIITVLRSVLDNIVDSGMIGAPKRPLRGRLLPILAVLGNSYLVLFVLLGMVALCGLAPNAHAQATGNTTIQPDCLIPFTFTAAGNFPATNVTGGAGDNRTKGCAAWTLMYQSTGLVMVTVTLQSGCSTSTTVSYGTFAGDIPPMPTGNANPIVSDTGGELQAINGTACISWVRVNVAATGSGTLTGVLYGFRNSSAAVNSGGGGGGGTCPQGPTGSVQYSDGTDCQGSASFIWDNADLLAKIGGAPITPFAGLYVGPDESTLDASIQGYTGANNVLFTSLNPSQFGAVGVEFQTAHAAFPGAPSVGIYSVSLGTDPSAAITSFEGDALLKSASTGSVAISFSAFADVLSGKADDLIGFKSFSNQGNAFNSYAFFAEDVTNGDNNYAFKSGAGMVEVGDATKAAGIHVQGAGAFDVDGLLTQLWLNPDDSTLTALRIGPGEPANLGSDGDGNAIQAAFSSDSTDGFLINFNRWSGSGAFPINFTYNRARGTIASPVNLNDGDNLVNHYLEGWVGGNWAYIGEDVWDYHTDYALRWIDGAPLLELGLSNNGNNPSVGFSPISGGVEINNGAPVSAGGSYSQLNLGVLHASSWISTLRNTAPDDGDIAANEMAIWFDPTNGAPNFRLKAKQADATVVNPIAFFGGYKSSDGTAGTTGNGFKNGLCTTASGACVGGAAFPTGTTSADEQCFASATTFGVCNNTTIAGRATEGSATLTADVVNPFINAKNTQSATAPGAAKCDIRMIAGTNAGTGKIVINCGTSATEVTIADNIGASF